MPLILVTNDDGVNAPGLHALFEEMKKIGRPIIIAPERDNSAASHSLTMARPLRVREIGPDIFAIDGTPADCVTIGVKKVLTERPLLVVSGINPGGNLGDDISYSGTVSAAIEGTMLGIDSFAISLVGEEPFLFQDAAGFAGRLARVILDQQLPGDTLLNVNVPGCPFKELKGVKFTRQGRRLYDDAIKETNDPWGRRHYWIGGGTPSRERGEDTDGMAIASGYISITPVQLDRTNHQTLALLRAQWTGKFE
ncbi:MAG: 5'/3'-nucleotidase SurE [Proteobacteria bacterium]|nr:5'/3'-nucleotidase SurE [Pseudomonadota bacterium]MBU1716865.1 5'/3'-nucleotidase SurE [Pseudomonadota bacterium]